MQHSYFGGGRVQVEVEQTEVEEVAQFIPMTGTRTINIQESLVNSQGAVVCETIEVCVGEGRMHADCLFDTIHKHHIREELRMRSECNKKQTFFGIVPLTMINSSIVSSLTGRFPM